MDAIIRHLRSGEHFLARLDDAGDATMLSPALPTYEAMDRDTGEVDWGRFEEADLEPWDDAADRWGSEQFTVVHRFED
jgi:hypothetical protein